MTAGARRPTWLWPVAAVAIAAVLAIWGRHLVAGLLLAIAVVFGLFVAGVLLWMLVSMALPGRTWTADSPREAARTAVAWVRSVWWRARRTTGAAPWRRPETVINHVADEVGTRVASLPTGRVAYAYLRIGLHPGTEARLDGWMPIEDIARMWAQAYSAATESIARTEDTITVIVSTDDRAPAGRALVTAGFRAPGDDGAMALARWPLRGPWAAAGPGTDPHTAIRYDRPGPAAPTHTPPGADDPSRGRPGADHDRDHGTVVLPGVLRGHPGDRSAPGPARPNDPGAAPPGTSGTQPEPGSPGAGASPGTDRIDATGQAPGADHAPAAGLTPGADHALAAGLTRLDRDGTVRLPAAGPRPAGSTDTTARRPRVWADRAPDAVPPPTLVLVRINPATGEPVTEPPLVATAPRATVGRASDRDLQIPFAHVSRAHAELRHSKGWAITDQRSQGGTFLNTKRIPPELPHPLKPGDTVEFARPTHGAPRALYRVQ